MSEIALPELLKSHEPKSIEELLANVDIDELKSKIPGVWPYEPRDYQWLAFKIMQDEIRAYEHPFIIKAAVSAGKSLILAMALRRIRDISMRSQQRALLLCKQGEIVEQDRDEAQLCGVLGSTMCASLGDKNAEMPIVFGSSGTVVNALKPGGDMADAVFRYLLIDECHHVDVTDIIESERAIYLPTIEDELNGMGDDPKFYQPSETNITEMSKAGRSQFTQIIRELQFRCMRKHGKPLVVIGVTGTDYRGIEPIVNTDVSRAGFWRKKVLDINTPFLVSRGYVVPTVFGSTEGMGYDLSEFHSKGRDGDDEFSAEDIAAMEAKITASSTETQRIMVDVAKRTLHRNAVLITCAGKKHCREAAACLPEGVTYCIIDDDMSSKERRDRLKEAKLNRIKFIFQIGCLTTGINCPPWDTIVILRKIGSLTLLEQLIGRGQRLLQQIHKDMGMVKHDNLVLDYAGAMHELAGLYFSEMLENYSFQTTKPADRTEVCPKCKTMNSPYARRCIHVDSAGVRCEHFFVSRTCDDIIDDKTGEVLAKGCGAENDTTSRYCRCCGNTLIDPNKPLKANAYSRNDYYDVLSFDVEAGKGESIAIKYTLSKPNEEPFTAYEIHHPLPTANAGSRAAWRKKFLFDHVRDPRVRGQIERLKTIGEILARASDFARPTNTTYRKSPKGRPVFGHKLFEADEF